MAGGGIREMVLDLLHRPLATGRAQAYNFNLGLALDLCIEKDNQGVHSRFILDCDESFLQYIGADRGVRRGLTESAPSYRRRLQRAPDDYQHAGNAWAVLSQVLGYLLSATPAARTVQTDYDADGTPLETRWQLYAAGSDGSSPPVYALDATGEWNWDQFAPTLGSWGRYRWYLVIESIAPNNWTDKAPKWGQTGTTWGNYSGSWGVTAPSTVGKSLKIIVGQWKSGYAHWIVLSFDATAFRPGSTVIADGYYGRWARLSGGVYIRARTSDGRYFRGQ